MTIEISGFARLLSRCRAFEGVHLEALESVLAQAQDPLEFKYYLPDVKPIVESGEPLTHLLFIQQGTIVPWQYPYSELRSPFLLGEHEVLLSEEQPRWVAHYSAVEESIVVEIPVQTIKLVIHELPTVKANMNGLVLRRLARFYWTSLSTTGTPESKVAAALVSRLALVGQDSGKNRILLVQQKELVRLTATSRTGVSLALATLAEAGLISVRRPVRRDRYITGELLVPDVQQLKDFAFSDVRERVINRLVHGAAQTLADAAILVGDGDDSGGGLAEGRSAEA